MFSTLCVWVHAAADSQADSFGAWERWAHEGSELNKTVIFEYVEADPEVADASTQWLWLSLLAHLARAVATCSWHVLVSESTFLFLPAVLERLACLDPEEPAMLGRLQGRLDDRFPVLGEIALPLLWLSAGVFVSKAWLQQDGVGSLDAEVCSYWSFEAMVAALRPKVQPHTNFIHEDCAFSFCLAAIRASPPVNFGSQMEQFVLGDKVLNRLRFRSKFAGSLAMTADDAEYSLLFMEGKEPPCVLVAAPAKPADFSLAHNLSTFLWARGCRSRHLPPVVPNNVELQLDCPSQPAVHGSSWTLTGIHAVYSGSDWRGIIRTQPVMPIHLDEQLKFCKASVLKRALLDHQSTFPLRSLELEGVLLFLGLPGGGTTWLTDVLADVGLQGRVSDLLVPYLHDTLRAEMSLILGSPEDMSYVNIWRTGNRAALAQLVDWVLHEDGHGEQGLRFTKEIINVARVTDLQAIGFRHIVALYRPRRYTFPVSDSGDEAGELCRSCFYRLMLESFLLQPCGIAELGVVRPLVLGLVEQSQAAGRGREVAGVIVHTLLWYLILRAGVRMLHYRTLMTATSSNIANDFNVVSGGLLNDTLVPHRFGEGIVASRQNLLWLETRAVRYEQLGVEHVARKIIGVLSRVDEVTDLSVLEAD